MVDPSWMIPIAALVVSLATGIYAVLGLRQKANQQSLEANIRRLDAAESHLATAQKDLRDCQIARFELQNKLMETMERIILMREQILELRADLLLKEDKPKETPNGPSGVAAPT